MPSSEDCINAESEVQELAIEQLQIEGHPLASATEIVRHMSYDERINAAERKLGRRIYRGAYSPY